MKKSLKSIISALMFTIIFTSAIPVFAAVDNDNNISTAKSINLNQIISGTLVQEGGAWDNDYYKFSISSPGYIEVVFNHEYGLGDDEVTVLNYDGNQEKILFKHKIDSTSQTYTFAKCGLSAGTYYIKIYGYKSNYNFKINYSASNSWEKEFNDNPTIAQNILLEKNIYGSLILRGSGAWDSDYHKFKLTKSGYINLHYNHEYGKGSDQVSIISYNGTNESTIFLTNVNQTSTSVNSGKIYLSAGTYYVKIYGYNSVYNFIVDYESNETTQKPTQTTKTTTIKTTANPTSTTKAQTTSSTATITQITENTTITTTVLSSFEQISLTEEEFIKNGDAYIYNHFEYNISNNTIIIVNYTGNESNVEIPQTINDVFVTGIASNAFTNAESTNAIEVPDSVTQFGKNAFGENIRPITLICSDSSAAQNYAEQNNVNYKLSDYSAISKKKDNSQTKAIAFAVIATLVTMVIIGAIIFIIIKNKKSKNSIQQ